MTEEPVRPRRWWRFSLRTLLICIAIAGMGFGWLQYQSRARRAAVRAIRESGGTVEYKYEFLKRVTPQGDWRVDEWLYRLDLVDPQSVLLQGKKIDDDYLREHLLALPGLEQLALDDVAVTNEGLLVLAALPKIEMLSCYRSPSNAKLSNELQAPTQIDFTEVPLLDAIAYLGDFHNVPFAIDNTEFEQVKIAADVPVTAQVVNVQLRDALDQMLGPARLGWVITKGGILITSATKAENNQAVVKKLRTLLPGLKYVEIDLDPAVKP